MLRVPSSRPIDSPRCDPRLPYAAFRYRVAGSPELISRAGLGAINVTAWLYRDKSGVEGIQVNPNVTIAELIRTFGPAPTSDAEVGFHSECLAAEWFRIRPDLKVLQIFTERAPCRRMCSRMLRHYYPGVPWYYYYDKDSWVGNQGELLKRAGELLGGVYGL